jgi:hypothetical protein
MAEILRPKPSMLRGAVETEFQHKRGGCESGGSVPHYPLVASWVPCIEVRREGCFLSVLGRFFLDRVF